jgi:hypothetical protein
MVLPPPSSAAHNGSQAFTVPNPEVLEKAERRIYTAEYKLRILQETDPALKDKPVPSSVVRACTPRT